MTKLALAGLALLICGVLVMAACSPVRAFDTMMPKDSESRKVASDIPYGEGPRRKLDVYAPVNAAKGPLPMIVFIYGGSWANGSRENYHFAGASARGGGLCHLRPRLSAGARGLFSGLCRGLRSRREMDAQARAGIWRRSRPHRPRGPLGGRLQCRDAGAGSAVPRPRSSSDQGFCRACRSL